MRGCSRRTRGSLRLPNRTIRTAGLLDAAQGLYTAAYQPVAPQADDFARPRNAGIRHDAGAAGDRRFQRRVVWFGLRWPRTEAKP